MKQKKMHATKRSEMQIYVHEAISLMNSVGYGALAAKKAKTIVKFTTLRQRVARNVSLQYNSAFS